MFLGGWSKHSLGDVTARRGGKMKGKEEEKREKRRKREVRGKGGRKRKGSWLGNFQTLDEVVHTIVKMAGWFRITAIH